MDNGHLNSALDAYHALYVDIANHFGFDHFDYDINDMRVYRWRMSEGGALWYWDADEDIDPNSPQYGCEIIQCSDGDDMTISKCGGFGAIALDDGCGNHMFGIFDMSKEIKD